MTRYPKRVLDVVVAMTLIAAQISGRNALAWEERFKLDVWYVDHWNLWLDLKILVLTVVRVCKKEGISAQGHVTMPEFLGAERPLES